MNFRVIRETELAFMGGCVSVGGTKAALPPTGVVQLAGNAYYGLGQFSVESPPRF